MSTSANNTKNAMTIDELLSYRSIDEAREAVVAMRRDSIDSTSRKELFERCGRLAAGLKKADLEHGDRIVILAPNSTDYLASVLGIMRAGMVVVPLDNQMPGEDLEHAFSDCDARMVFTTSALRKRLPKKLEGIKVYLYDADSDSDSDSRKDAKSWSELLADDPADAAAKAEDTAVIFYTSGTTGPPKGVPLTHANLSSNVKAMIEQDIADESDRLLVPLPFHHVYPFSVGILIPLALGAPVIMPYSLVGPQIVRALRDGKATIMLGVPRLYEAVWTALQGRVESQGKFAATLFSAMLSVSVFARERLKLNMGKRLFKKVHENIAPDLRLMVTGGGPLDPELGTQLRGLGWDLAIGYGLSETSPILTFNPPDRLRIEAAGIPLPNVELKIDDSKSDKKGRGEVLARGPNVFGGYLNLDEKNEEVLDGDGWFRTGDTGGIDSDGYLHLYGRESAMIVLSEGENIDPEKVEQALQAPEEIKEAGVLEYEDDLAAVVVPEAKLLREAEGENLKKRIESTVKDAAGKLPSHHRPSKLRISMDPLPRTRLGKLRRHKLEELFKELAKSDEVSKAKAEPVSPESMAPEDAQLLDDPSAKATWNYLAKRFKDHRLTPDTSLAQDLGIDSLSWVDLTLALRDQAGIELEDEAVARVESVRDLLKEAAGAEQAGEAGKDLAEELEDPEEMLDSSTRAMLEPPGPLRRAFQWVLLGITRLVSRLVMRVEVEGRFPDKGHPYVVAPRHASVLDPLALLRGLRRDQLESMYWAGWTGLLFSNPASRAFSRTARVLPVDPGASPRKALAVAAACLKRDYSLVWFPEGERSPDGRLQRLRPGIGQVLQAQPVPVIPVWIDGTFEAMPPGKRWPRFGRRVRLVIGEPLKPEDYGDSSRKIVEKLHAALEDLGNNNSDSKD